MEKNLKSGDPKIVRCWNCGKPADETTTSLPTVYRRCYCKECYKKETAKQKAEKELYVKLKKREMFRRALSILESQRVDMYKLKEAIDAVQDFIEEYPDKFDSSYEVLTAIVLIHHHIRCKMQYRVGRYQVDFLLPDHLAILEIDGDRHRKARDNVRDREIKRMLGGLYEIIRIPTELIDKDALKIPEAIDKVIEYRETNHINWREIYK